MDGGGRCQKRSQAAGELNNTAQAQECWIAATGSSAATDFAATQQGLSKSLDQALSVRDHQVASRISIAAGGAQIPHYWDSSGKTEESFVATTLVSSRSSAVLFPPLPRASFSAGEVTRSSTRQCRSLASLCVGYLGEHLEDIIDDIHEIAPAFPVEVKGKLLAIARRRRLLCDELLVALADSSWEILDVSGSDVTDASIEFVAILCHRLQDVDISHCSRLTAKAVEALVQHCSALRTLRCGGTPKSDMTARRSLSYILPRLDHKEEAEESWEDLDTKSVGKGAQALRWLVWPSIDSNSKELLEMECPRIVVNPVASWKTFGLIPREAQRGIVLDNPLIEDIDPKTWAVVISSRPQRFIGNTLNKDNGGLSVAERFRLAFVSRDERLAPKRAKNMRQNQRRADKAWLSSDSEAKAQVWAGIARKSLKHLAI